MAAECIAVSRRMSLHSERERMEAKAKRWTELANEAEQAMLFDPAQSLTQQAQPQQAQQSKLKPEQ